MTASRRTAVAAFAAAMSFATCLQADPADPGRAKRPPDRKPGLSRTAEQPVGDPAQAQANPGQPELQTSKTFVTAGEVQPPPNITALLLQRRPVEVSVYVDTLTCLRESVNDGWTNSDEPYLIMTAMHSQAGALGLKAPRTSLMTAPRSDVDAGETYSIRAGAVRGQVLRPGEAIGLLAQHMERDEWSYRRRREEAENFCNKIQQRFEAPPDGYAADPRTRQNPFWHCQVNPRGLYGTGYRHDGPSDDHGAESSVGMTYAQLLAQGALQVPFEMHFPSGAEGEYLVRGHFGLCDNVPPLRKIIYNEWDSFAVGNFRGGNKDQMLLVSDEQAEGPDGRFYIMDAEGNALEGWDAPYAKFDRVAVGNVVGDARDEIVVASGTDGRVRVYSWEGTVQREFPSPFRFPGGLAVGNVHRGGSDEIIILTQDRVLRAFNDAGQEMMRMSPPGLTKFVGARYWEPYACGDALLAGDVAGDDLDDVIIIENRNGPNSIVHVYVGGTTTCFSFCVRERVPDGVFCLRDAATLGDVTGDGKLELLLATDECAGRSSCVIRCYPLAGGATQRRWHWPLFSANDGFAFGDVLGTGSGQVVIVEEDDGYGYGEISFGQ